MACSTPRLLESAVSGWSKALPPLFCMPSLQPGSPSRQLQPVLEGQPGATASYQRTFQVLLAEAFG